MNWRYVASYAIVGDLAISPESGTSNICPVQANSEANRKETLHRKGILTDIPPPSTSETIPGLRMTLHLQYIEFGGS